MEEKSKVEKVMVAFYQSPLSVPLEEVEAVLTDDPLLHHAIKEYSKELAKDNIETFKIDRNMIITEEGYKIAFRESDMEAFRKENE